MGFWESKTRGLRIQGKHELYTEDLFQNKKEWRECEVVQRTEALSHKPAGLNLVPRTHIKGRRKEPTP